MMKIGEFSRDTGLSKDTIRYYEKIGLLHPEIINKHREYTKEDIEIIQAIIKLKQTDFSLHEIKMLFDWSRTADQNKKVTKDELPNILRIKEVFKNKYNQMLQKEEQIKQTKEILLRADAKLEQLLEKIKQ